MNDFEKVASVWNDLENAYTAFSKKNSIGRLDYVKRLLLWDSGEVGYRKLTGRVTSCTDVPADKVSQLLEKIENARKNVEFFISIDKEPETLADFTTPQVRNAESVNVYCNVDTEIVGLRSILQQGFILPPVEFVNGCIVRYGVSEYYAVSINDSSLVTLLAMAQRGMLTNRLSAEKQLALAKYVATQYQAGKLHRKLIVAESSALPVLKKFGLEAITVSSANEFALIDVTANGETISFVVVDYELE